MCQRLVPPGPACRVRACRPTPQVGATTPAISSGLVGMGSTPALASPGLVGLLRRLHRADPLLCMPCQLLGLSSDRKCSLCLRCSPPQAAMRCCWRRLVATPATCMWTSWVSAACCLWLLLL